MYAVAVNTNERKFSLTCRDLAKSPHWYQTMSKPHVIHDTRNPEQKLFTVMAEFATETEARKFKAVVEAAYISNGYTQEFINAPQGE